MSDKIEFIAHVPPIQAMFKALDGGGARIALELDPKAAFTYYPFMVKAN